MPPVSDPRVKARVLAAAQPVNPVTAQPTVSPNGAVTFPMDVDRQLGNQQTSTSITGQEVTTTNAIQDQAAENRGRAATGGVDTTESENRAAFLTIPMVKAQENIENVFRAYPNVMKPGWTETIGGWFGDTPKNLVIPEEIKEQRQVLNLNFEDFVRNALTLATGAAYKDEELAGRIRLVAPQVTDTPAALEDKRKRLITYLEAARAQSGGGTYMIDEAIRRINRLYTGLASDDPQKAFANAIEGSAQVTPSTTTGSKEVPPEIQNRYANALINVPRGQLTPEKYREIVQQTYGEYAPPQLDDKTVSAFVESYNNPANPVDITIPAAQMPLDKTEAAWSGVLQTPGGTAATSFANAMGMGIPEMLAGDNQREALDQVKNENWKSNLLGEVVGSVGPTMALEKALALGIPKVAPHVAARGFTSLLSDVGGNAAYGGARGAADDDSTFLGGLAAGTAGSLAGRAAASGARGFMGTRTLDDLKSVEGMDLTTLQRMGLGKTEEIFHDVPFVRGARGQAIESFNLRDANNTLARIGEKLPPGTHPGTEAAREVAKALSNRYNQLRPLINGTMDDPFDRASQALRTQTAARPEMGEFWKNEVDSVTKNLFSGPNARVTGDTYREAMTRLRALEDSMIKKYENQGELWALDTAQLLGKYRAQIRAMIGRQNPQIAEDLKQVERAWAESVRIDDAVLRASANDGVYTPNQKDLSIKKLDTSPRQSASAHGRALGQSYAQAGRRLMGAKGVPDSIGFWKTAAVMFGPGAAGAVGSATDTGTLAALASGLQMAAWAIGVPSYTIGVKRAMQAITSGKRPAAADNAIVRAIIAQATRELLDTDQMEGVE